MVILGPKYRNILFKNILISIPRSNEEYIFFAAHRVAHVLDGTGQTHD